ncbi:MAG TPA: MMPL family transporter [Solirubrobacterales bacterium]|jgi:RND superfamily putative drug exporter|nr:MMPL family transporter [Solirubrobacterales bacterium]
MLRHPKRTLAVAAVLIAILVAFGLSLNERLSPATLDIRGTPVHQANGMLRKYFGDTSPFAILLQGPPKQIDEQGPELIRGLRRDPKVTTLSPWDRGFVNRLRPNPRKALIVADFHVDNKEAVNEKVPLLEEEIERTIHAPVRATQSGFATVSKAILDESISSSEKAELIALPILLIVLLLVFRSPVAAAIPLGFGAIAVFTSRGLLSLLTHVFDVDSLALTVCSMMGLALGVDYALLLVSRFREELDSGADPLEAAWSTRRTAGRTTVFAGCTLVLSMVVALFVVPGALLASLAGTLALVVILTVAAATLIGPPVLVLVGHNVNRWRIGAAPNGERSRLMKVVGAALSRPVPVALAIGGIVLLLAAPALALKTGPFSVGELSKDSQARVDAEHIQSEFGSGFEAPFTIVAAANEGTITEASRLEALTRWQHRIAETPGVQTVVGPGQVSRAVKPLQKGLSGILASNENVGPLAGLNRLGKNLNRLAGGVTAIRGGLSRATSGAALLAEGTGRAEEGAIEIASGIGQAASGSQEAIDAIGEVAKGNKELAKANERAAVGALQIKFGSHDLIPILNANGLPRAKRLQRSLDEDSTANAPQAQATAQATNEKLAAALKELEGMTVGKSDPNYAATLDALREASGTASTLTAELTVLQEHLATDAHEAREIKLYIESTLREMRKLAAASKRLSDGLKKIETGSKKLATGTAKLDHEASKELSQLGPFQEGAEQLVAGLSRLTGGTTELEHRLGEFYSRSYPVESGARRIAVRVESQNESLNRRVDRLKRTSPGIFDSGYFVLSALDGTRGRLHERASEAVNLNTGGQAIALTVFSKYGFNSDGSIALNKQLEKDAAELGKEANIETGVAGGPATLNTYSHETKARMPYVIASITLATFLVLVLVLRALPLAAIAVGLNIATVAVAFGVLTLLTHVPEGWPLGGRTYVDAVGATMIFGVVFGLSIDYAVFLLVRMREHYDREGDNAAAIEFGLEKTARVITGAAVIMMAVFIAFAGTPIATVSQLGVGLTVAVLLDATVVRIVLLPALMLLVGDKVWWLPRSLERVLPRLNV